MQLSDFGSWGSRAFAFGPQFSLPLFNGGRLQGMANLREAQQQEAALAYQQTVLRAWHEIDDQLTRYNASQLRRDSLAEAVRQNQIALTTAQHQYVEGVADFVNVLTVQSALLATQEQWVERLDRRVVGDGGVCKALGEDGSRCIRCKLLTDELTKSRVGRLSILARAKKLGTRAVLWRAIP